MIKVPQHVIDHFIEIRESGACNMFDRHCVQYEANDREFYDLVILCEDKRDYQDLLFNNIEVEESEEAHHARG